MIENYMARLDSGVDQVLKTARPLFEAFELTTFAYVRIYHDGRLGWVTSSAEHDCLLIERDFLNEDPLLDTREALHPGCYLWSHDREFPGSTAFYEDRARFFGIDHGMILVREQVEYLETSCFSGLFKKKPLYNDFINQLGLFHRFTDYFKQELTPTLNKLLQDGTHLKEIKSSYGKEKKTVNSNKQQALLKSLGLGHLLTLSPRECDCLRWLKEGYTYQGIGKQLKLSDRTVESYLNSVKNKLNLSTHQELIQVAHLLVDFNLIEK